MMMVMIANKLIYEYMTGMNGIIVMVFHGVPKMKSIDKL